MSKVITLSTTFPKGHPQAGHPTYFPQKIWKSLGSYFFKNYGTDITSVLYELNKSNKVELHQLEKFVLKHQCDFSEVAGVKKWQELHPKNHTIRAGERWKTGDTASLRVWSDKPYCSPQIIIALDVQLTVKEVCIANGLMWIDSMKVGWGSVAKNDGLTMEELRYWFNTPVFTGQILIWNNNNLPY